MKTTTLLLVGGGLAAACYFLYIKPKSDAAAGISPQPSGAPAPPPPLQPSPVPSGVLTEEEILRKSNPALPPSVQELLKTLPGLPPLAQPPPPGQAPANAGQSPELLALLSPLSALSA